MMLFKRLRKHLRGRRFFSDPNHIFSNHSLVFNKTHIAVQFFYICLFAYSLFAFQFYFNDIKNSPLASPQWYLYLFGWPYTRDWIILLAFYLLPIVSGKLALNPNSRSLRITAFILTLNIVGLTKSNGSSSASPFFILYPTFFLQFLPYLKSQKSRQDKHLYIQTFWAAQFSIGLSYFMSGYFKVIEVPLCLFERGLSDCEVGPNILLNMIARETLQFQWFTYIGDFFYSYTWLAGTIYLGITAFHILSIYTSFRLHLQALVLVLRFSFHLATLYVTGIVFNEAMFGLVALFAINPFSYEFSSKKYIINNRLTLRLKNSAPKNLKRLKIFSWGLLIYTVVHLIFMMSYTFTGQNEVYPLYTWRIFKPYPEKYMRHAQILIHSLRGQKLDPPQNVLKIKAPFPRFSAYHLSTLTYDYMEHDYDRNKIQPRIEQDLLNWYGPLEYEIREYNIDPVIFIRDNKYISSKILLKNTIMEKSNVNE